MISFGVRLNPTLERSNIRGEPARVRLDRDALVIEGAISGRLSIPTAEVARLRLYVHASRVRTFHGVRAYYSARIKRTGGDEILLTPVAPPGAYGPVMRAFAQAIGLPRVETGRNRIMAWAVWPASVALLTLLTFTFARHAARTGALGDWLAAGFFAAMLALFLPALPGIRIRPVRSLKEIDAMLPPD